MKSKGREYTNKYSLIDIDLVINKPFSHYLLSFFYALVDFVA